jgi:hypothetical protein
MALNVLRPTSLRTIGLLHQTDKWRSVSLPSGALPALLAVFCTFLLLVLALLYLIQAPLRAVQA